MVAKLEDGEYMAFGLSGDPRRSKMIGGDVTVAWMDHSTGKGYAEDYYLDAKSQCAGDRGSCPDNNIPLGILYSIHCMSRLYEMQKVPRKIAPKN